MRSKYERYKRTDFGNFCLDRGDLKDDVMITDLEMGTFQAHGIHNCWRMNIKLVLVVMIASIKKFITVED